LLVFVYFQYEILFSVHDEQDPAIMIVQKLIERYPKVDAKLFIGEFYYLVLFKFYRLS